MHWGGREEKIKDIWTPKFSTPSLLICLPPRSVPHRRHKLWGRREAVTSHLMCAERRWTKSIGRGRWLVYWVTLRKTPSKMLLPWIKYQVLLRPGLVLDFLGNVWRHWRSLQHCGGRGLLAGYLHKQVFASLIIFSQAEMTYKKYATEVWFLEHQSHFVLLHRFNKRRQRATASHVSLSDLLWFVLSMVGNEEPIQAEYANHFRNLVIIKCSKVDDELLRYTGVARNSFTTQLLMHQMVNDNCTEIYGQRRDELKMRLECLLDLYDFD